MLARPVGRLEEGCLRVGFLVVFAVGAVWGATLEEPLGCALIVRRHLSKSVNHAICMITIIMKVQRIPLANTMSVKSALLICRQL